MRTRLFLPAIVLAWGLALSSRPAGADTEVYRYVDENGTIHFTNMPSDPRYTRLPEEKKPPKSEGDRRSRPYEKDIVTVADRYDVDPDLLRAVIKCESNFNHLAVSRAGAQGLMQLMPETARMVDVDNPFNAMQNLDGGAKYLKYLLNSFDDTRHALAAYNAGEGAVRRHGGIPPYRETRNYVSAVLAQYDRYRSLGAGSDPITSADIQSFVNSEGVRLFTNVPWKYRKTGEWKKVDGQ